MHQYVKFPCLQVFKYDVGLEKHKLFVSNLSFHTTEDTLHKAFSKHGPLKGVRVVTNRKGQSKVNIMHQTLPQPFT